MSAYKPDWNELEACRESLREHMEIIKKLRVTEEYWRLLVETGASELKGVVSCGWTLDHDGECWDTGCGHAFVIIDGNPEENGMIFCPYCGNKIAANASAS